MFVLVAFADFASVGVEDVLAQGVDCFAFVELAVDPPPVRIDLTGASDLGGQV